MIIYTDTNLGIYEHNVSEFSCLNLERATRKTLLQRLLDYNTELTRSNWRLANAHA